MRILIVEDHPLFAEALSMLCRQARPDAEIDHRSTLGEALMALDRHGGYALVTLDMNLPDCKGIGALQAVRARVPDVPVLVLTAVDNRMLHMHAAQEGASAVLTKDASPDRILQTVRRLADAGNGDEHQQPPQPVQQDPIDGLTARQREVLAALAAGVSNAEIAEKLSLSLNTVKTHVRDVFAQIGARNRTDAARIWIASRRRF